MSKSVERIVEISYHRNGSSGVGFHVVKFIHDKRLMLAVVFEEPWCTAVFDYALLAEGNIKFRENSWRGDAFEKELRAAIEKWSDEWEPTA